MRLVYDVNSESLMGLLPKVRLLTLLQRCKGVASNKDVNCSVLNFPESLSLTNVLMPSLICL